MIATQKADKIAPGKERTFLYGTAVRVAANARRAEQRRKHRPLADALAIAGSSPQPERLTDEATLLRIEALKRLKQDARAAELGQRFIEENPGSPLADRVCALGAEEDSPASGADGGAR